MAKMPVASQEPGSSLRVEEGPARMVVLVMSLELLDGGRLLSREQREEASNLIWAGLPAGGKGLSDRDWFHSFLVPRARRLFEEAAAKSLRVRDLVDPRHRQDSWTATILIGALILGFLVDRISNVDQINLLAAPLGLFIVWNWCAICAALLIPLLPRSPQMSEMGQRALSQGSRLLTWSPRTPAWFRHAAHEHYGRWVEIAAPLIYSRLTRVLHLAAIAVAVGAICSVTWSAWHREFRVGWASTLCKANCVSVLHNFVFSPTLPLSEVIGAVPFSREEIVRMERWQQPDNGEGERWLRLTATLLLVTVIVPRALLAAVAARRVTRLRSNLTLQLGQPYFQSLRTPRDVGTKVDSSVAGTGTPRQNAWQRFRDWLRRSSRSGRV
jgi:Protein of unknown function (DUF2868)